jgi:hypothetical protein
MQTELRGYSATISKYTGVTDQPTLDEIEELMRDEFHTLNHLSPQKFARSAKECLQAVQYMRTPEGQAYMAELNREIMGL